MIPPETVRETRRLLAEGKLSQRKIAKLLRISRGTVGGIASGKRTDYIRRPTNDDEPIRPSGPPKRCPDCGHMVYMPCRICRARSERDRRRSGPVRRLFALLDEPLGLNLREEHQRRYEKVHAQHEAVMRASSVTVEPETLLAADDQDLEIEFLDAPDFGSIDFWDDLQAVAL